MNCQEVQERLTDVLLDEAPGDERQTLLDHADGCAVCGAEAEDIRQTLDLLREAEWPAGIDLGEERRLRLLERAAKRRQPVRWIPVLATSGAAAAIIWAVTVPSLLRARLPAQAGPGGIATVNDGVVGGVVGGLPDVPRDMYFEHRGTNPFVATEKDALSTFGLDVDTASYTLTRNYLRRGMLPPPEAVRIEEFVNAMPQDYPAETAATFGIHLEAASSPFQDGRTFLRVGIRAKDVPRADRKAAHLSFVVDVSGSMGMENRLGLVRRSLRLLVDSLDERDWIGIVVYGTNGRVVLEPAPLSDREAILEAIEGLEPEGSTNLEEGLALGYEMAARSYDPTVTNRVVLCTDGVANNGVSDPRALLRQIKQQAGKGIDMIALGVGMGNYNDALLQKLADEGDGQYAYIDDFAEAKRFFLRDLTGVLETVARDARAQVEFDPRRVERYRLIGYEKRDIADEDFRNDVVDAGEVNAGQTVTVLYELSLMPGDGPLGTVRVRHLDPQTGTPDEVQREIGVETASQSFEEASAPFQLTVLAARFAEHLRKSQWVPRTESLHDVLRLAGALPPATAGAAEAKDLLGLLRDAARLSDRSE